MFKKLIGALLGLSLIGVTFTAKATVIDTTGVDTATIVAFGSPDTATYGQTLFDFSGSDTVLNSFSLFLRNRYSGSGTLDLRGYVAEWDGSKSSNILFESSTQTMNAAGNLQEFAFNVGGINLAVGNDYVFYLSTANLPIQPTSLFGMPRSGDLINGGFVFKNESGGGWSNSFGAYDVFFKASLSPVPLPASLPLMLTGLGLMRLLGWWRRRRAQAAA